MKGTLIILCLSVSLISCGKLRTQRLLGKIIPAGNIAGLEEPIEHSLKLPELKLAHLICSSLATKATNIKSALIGTPPKQVAYAFTLERKNCNASVVESKNITAQISISNSSELDFSTLETANFFEDVITDKTIALSSICTKVLDPQTTLEKKEELKLVSNAIILSNRIYLVALGTNDKGFNTVQINTKTFNSKTGGYDPLDMQVISIITDISQDTGGEIRNIGVEKERTKYVLCTGKLFTSQKETFVRSYFTL